MNEIKVSILKTQLALFESQCQMLRELIYNSSLNETKIKEIFQILVELNKDLVDATYKLRKEDIKHE